MKNKKIISSIDKIKLDNSQKQMMFNNITSFKKEYSGGYKKIFTLVSIATMTVFAFILYTNSTPNKPTPMTMRVSNDIIYKDICYRSTNKKVNKKQIGSAFGQYVQYQLYEYSNDTIVVQDKNDYYLYQKCN